jgi:hypothetical protein
MCVTTPPRRHENEKSPSAQGRQAKNGYKNTPSDFSNGVATDY